MPVATINDPGRRPPLVGSGYLAFFPDNHKFETVTMRLRGPVVGPVPRPRWDVVDTPGQVGLTDYLGRDPFQAVVPGMFDAFPNGSIEGAWSALSALAVGQAGKDRAPQPFRVIGPAPVLNDDGRRWVITDVAEVTDRTFVSSTANRSRFAADITVLEHITDHELAESIRSSKKTARGIANFHTTVRQGETSLYDVARRVYHDPSRASDIARANSIKGVPLRLGQKLKAGMGLRLP